MTLERGIASSASEESGLIYNSGVGGSGSSGAPGSICASSSMNTVSRLYPTPSSRSLTESRSNSDIFQENQNFEVDEGQDELEELMGIGRKLSPSLATRSTTAPMAAESLNTTTTTTTTTLPSSVPTPASLLLQRRQMQQQLQLQQQEYSLQSPPLTVHETAELFESRGLHDPYDGGDLVPTRQLAMTPEPDFELFFGYEFEDFEAFERQLEQWAIKRSFMVILLRSQRPGNHIIQATFGCYKSGIYKFQGRSAKGPEAAVAAALQGSAVSIASPGLLDPSRYSADGISKSVKTNCPFQVNIRYNMKNKLYHITKMNLDHNHVLSTLDLNLSNIIDRKGKRKRALDDSR